MKKPFANCISGPRGLVLSILLTMLIASPVSADTAFTAEGRLIQVPLAGITVTNPLKQVMIKGNVHVLAIQTTDPRSTGRLQAGMDMSYQSDGTATYGGTAYAEVGTWANGTNFTPAAGVWALDYHGVAQADGSGTLTASGYGIGGNVDCLQIEVTMTRGPGPILDPALPYVGSGVIKSAPVYSCTTLDDFEDGLLRWDAAVGGTAKEANGKVTLAGNWPNPTGDLMDTLMWMGKSIVWGIPSRQCVELRADLVSLSDTASGTVISLYHATGQGYGLTKAKDWLAVWKQHSGGVTCLGLERVKTPNTNVVLSLGITPSGVNMVLTARVLDKKTGETYGYASAVDTVAVDPSYTPAELSDVTDMAGWQSFVGDQAGAPWRDGINTTLMMFQDTDGTKPEATAVFGNLELVYSSVPQVATERAVVIRWPDTGKNYNVESAQSASGPYKLVNPRTLPGTKQATFPASKGQEFFRLIEAP